MSNAKAPKKPLLPVDQIDCSVATWKNAPPEWAPAIVLTFSSGATTLNALATVLITDDPNPDETNDFFVIPAKELEDHMTLDRSPDRLCPPHLKGEFLQMHAHLQNSGSNPMLGPLFYLRTATLMQRDKMSCQEAIEKNVEIENGMRQWITRNRTKVQVAIQHAQETTGTTSKASAKTKLAA